MNIRIRAVGSRDRLQGRCSAWLLNKEWGDSFEGVAQASDSAKHLKALLDNMQSMADHTGVATQQGSELLIVGNV